MAGVGSPPTIGRCRARASSHSTCTPTAASIRAAPRPATPRSATSSTRRIRCRRSAGAFSRLDPVAYAGAFDQTEGPDVLRLHAALPAAGLARRRAGVPDGAVARRSADRRADRSGAMGRDRWTGHRLHRQADRRSSASRRLSAGLRYEPDRRDRAAALRQGPSGRSLAHPDEVVGIKITLFPTANLFLPGHRIRLDVSSSNFPKFDVNPNTGEPEGAALRKRVAINTVFMDATRPSSGDSTHSVAWAVFVPVIHSHPQAAAPGDSSMTIP